MDISTLQALGISTDDLQNRIVDKAVQQLLTSVSFDEDGDDWREKSPLARKLEERIKQQLDNTINALADKHILSNVAGFIENLTLQETNRWGEKTGQRMTFIEYLTARADAYMHEKVDYKGKTQDEAGSYSWSGAQTRLTHLVHSHLHFSIETAMKQAMQVGTTEIAKALQETARMKLNEIAAQVKVSVTTGR